MRIIGQYTNWVKVSFERGYIGAFSMVEMIFVSCNFRYCGIYSLKYYCSGLWEL